jgi:regulator of cell morphogenesis and NO signaling
MKLANVIHLDYLLLPIIGRFGIELGFGNKTVCEICEKKQIQLSFFLEILNSYHNNDYFAEDQFQDYPLVLIINYLKNTHNYYINTKMPELEAIINQFIEYSSPENKSNNTLIANFFKEYKKEFINHLKQEESYLFQYTKELELALFSGILKEETRNKIENKFIHQNDDGHNDLEEKLYDLKNLIIKFLPPVKHQNMMEKLLIELFQLENDLKDHSRIEDKVLVPRIIQTEQKIVALHDPQ